MLFPEEFEEFPGLKSWKSCGFHRATILEVSCGVNGSTLLTILKRSRRVLQRRTGEIKLRITTQGDYALRCLLNIAKNSKKGPVAISRIVEEEALPSDYIEQLLMKLRRRNLIKSVRGSKGGYLLGRSEKKISVKNVLEAVEGSAFEIICSRKRNDGSKKCLSGACALKKVWVGLKERIEDYLGKVTLDVLLRKKEG